MPTEEAIMYVVAGYPRPRSIVRKTVFMTYEEAAKLRDDLNAKYHNTWSYSVFEAVISVMDKPITKEPDDDVRSSTAHSL